MKRYFAFEGDIYYPSQGMGDFVGDFATLDEAITALTPDNKTQDAWINGNKWAIVWDSEKRVDVWDSGSLIE